MAINFNNIYIEKSAIGHPTTVQILDKLNNPNFIEINHYKDVFCRPKQNTLLQKNKQSLILALKQNDYIYPGASVCQDFGNTNFYYSSCVMNCACNCEYCYLKGMYPSGNLVVFVNLDDYFKNIGNENKYICVSYDTDLFPLESSLGYVKRWLDFAKSNENVKLEIRTKCKNLDVWKYNPSDNVIFAFSLSPQHIIDSFEHKTSYLDARLENIKAAQNNKFKTRLCFDPIIYCKNWKQQYKELIEKTFTKIDAELLEDISIGSFRISQSYLKNMRKFDYESSLVNFPFTNVDGYYQYNPELQKQMENYVFNELANYFDEKRIYLWK